MELKGCILWIRALACLECSSESQTPVPDCCAQSWPCQLQVFGELTGFTCPKGENLWILCKALISFCFLSRLWWRRKRKRPDCCGADSP